MKVPVSRIKNLTLRRAAIVAAFPVMLLLNTLVTALALPFIFVIGLAVLIQDDIKRLFNGARAQWRNVPSQPTDIFK
jgi:hypothetical protein